MEASEHIPAQVRLKFFGFRLLMSVKVEVYTESYSE